MNVVQATKNKKKGHARVKSITLTPHMSEERSLNNARFELPDLNVPYAVQAAVSIYCIHKHMHNRTHLHTEVCS